MKKTVEEKFSTVIQKNTFYFFSTSFEENYEGYINSLKETLLIVKNKVETEGLKKEIFEWLLKEKENGLRALLALTGFSNEYLKRLTTIIRIVDNPELNTLVYKAKWYNETSPENIKEWSDATISKLIHHNEYFRKGLVNIFFEGASIPFLTNTIPLFELKKLSISKLKFDISELIDTLIRYKEKGSYSGMKGNNPETVVAGILENLGISYETGDLSELIANAFDNKRTMDFIIPNKKNPLLIVESSFLATTSSGQGDKSKTEISIDTLIREHYPNAKFIGFVDGIGWYVRKGDLARMVTAYEDVFTFHKDELERFEKLLIETFKNDR
ncbi:MAG: DpnII family type II restriction endonuclease [bacterium]